jgi:hypothetical protein
MVAAAIPRDWQYCLSAVIRTSVGLDTARSRNRMQMLVLYALVSFITPSMIESQRTSIECVKMQARIDGLEHRPPDSERLPAHYHTIP